MAAGESCSSEAAVRRRSAMACAYSSGLRVEPGWRGASTASTSGLWLVRTDAPTQASTSPLALSSTSTAPSCTLRPASSCIWRCSCCTARRCKGAERVLRSCVPGGWPARRRRARCGAIPSLGDQALRCITPAAYRPRLSHSTALRGVFCMMAKTPQARRPTASGPALGARTSAAVMAASRASRPCAALPNSVRLSASMPTISPRKGTRLR